eukprot:TRINITY_DN144_c0_g4_i1.p1 TRINITY_DN144_c0_g4~~TRINITY_DN144_c0_g4_i1.p1  ORF type:complete len:281 (-),score=77.18 TRINITY_DN144_c0_g4_i1:1010-1852(-)
MCELVASPPRRCPEAVLDYRRAAFNETLQKFRTDRGKAQFRPPVVHKVELDLFELFQRVCSFGGYSSVVRKIGTWSTIWKLLPNYDAAVTDASNRLKKNYEKYLLDFERFCHPHLLRCPPPDPSSPQPPPGSPLPTDSAATPLLTARCPVGSPCVIGAACPAYAHHTQYTAPPPPHRHAHKHHAQPAAGDYRAASSSSAAVKRSASAAELDDGSALVLLCNAIAFHEQQPRPSKLHRPLHHRAAASAHKHSRPAAHETSAAVDALLRMMNAPAAGRSCLL